MKSIGFKNFKKFAECPSLELSGINFLVGKNNAGKSSFIHAATIAANFINQTSSGHNIRPVLSFDVETPASIHDRGFNCVRHRGAKDGAIEFNIDYGDYVVTIGVYKRYNPFAFVEDNIVNWVYDSYYEQYPDAETEPKIDEEWLNAEVEKELKRFQQKQPDEYKKCLEEDLEGRGEISFIKYYDKANRVGGIINLQRSTTELIFNEFPNERDEELGRLRKLLEDVPEEDKPSIENRIDELAAEKDKSTFSILRNIIISKGITRNEDAGLPVFWAIEDLAGNCLKGEQELSRSFDDLDFEKEKMFLEKHSLLGRLEDFANHFSSRLSTQIPSCARHIGHFTDNQKYNLALFQRFIELEIPNNRKLMGCIDKWVKELEIGEGLRIHPLEPGEENECFMLQKARIAGKEQDYEVMFDSLGVGSRQLIILLINMAIVIAEAKLKKYPTLVTIEEPEQNLHPAMQGKLAEMFLDFYLEFGLQSIIETHSEYIIRRSQVLVAKGLRSKKFSLEDNPFKVYYFPDNADPYDMGYMENGRFSNKFGPGFMDVAGDSNLELLDLTSLIRK